MSVLQRVKTAKRIGILFGGGSARAVFQVGVLETLTELGIEPSAVLGVSAGSWNAAVVAVGNARRLRAYWRFFCRMPYVDLANVLTPEHSPFVWRKLHARAFDRYIGTDGIRAAPIPVYVSLTRLRDRQNVVLDVRHASDPFHILLASNYLPPFYTHSPVIEGERYGDGGFSNNVPYEALFAAGCDLVILLSSKGESEGPISRSAFDEAHALPADLDDRILTIRPRHRMPLSFVERRWEKLAPIARLGALRAREVLLGERHAECDLAAPGKAFSARVLNVRNAVRKIFA